jgi:hypothetical protein
MKLTRSQKISMGVLGVAVLAFIGDRIFFQPNEAGAAQVPQQQQHEQAAPADAAKADSPGATSVAAASPAAGPSEQLISEKLKSMRGVDVTRVRDALQPSQKWVDAQRPPAAVAARPERNPVNEFVAAHRLSAVIASRTGDGGDAIVDGQPIRVGQRVGDWRLIGVTTRSATFLSGTGSLRATLQLPR